MFRYPGEVGTRESPVPLWNLKLGGQLGSLQMNNTKSQLHTCEQLFEAVRNVLQRGGFSESLQWQVLTQSEGTARYPWGSDMKVTLM